MKDRDSLASAIDVEVNRYRDEAVSLLQDLVRIPSVNHPPTGDEKKVQEFYHRTLSGIGLETELLYPLDVPGFAEHPGRLKDHDMTGRPNAVGVLKGQGGGRSLMLMAHADVELPGPDDAWIGADPFSGRIEQGRVYGRGAGDDKVGMAIGAMTARIVLSLGRKLAGDLVVASVADEEQGGSNGAVALLAAGIEADARMNLDGGDREIWGSNLGGGYCRMEISVPPPRADASAVADAFDRVREAVKAFKATRQEAFRADPFYHAEEYRDASVRMMTIELGSHGMHRGSCTVWFYLLPGESAAVLQQEFSRIVGEHKPDGCEVSLQWMSRFLPASVVPAEDPFVSNLKQACAAVTGRVPAVRGSWMSDMGFMNHYGKSSCVSFSAGRPFGAEGGPHQPNEYVEIEAYLECIKVVTLTALTWCGG